MLCGREMLILDLFADPLTDHPDQASQRIDALLSFSAQNPSRQDAGNGLTGLQMITGAQETAVQTHMYDQNVNQDAGIQSCRTCNG